MTPLFFGIALISSAAAVSDGACPSTSFVMMNGSQWYEGQPVDAELPERNRITLFKSGTLAWNGYEISSDELKGLLEEVSKQEFGPLTQFEWEPGAPCATIEQVRGLMNNHLECAGTRHCMEGPDPRLPPQKAGR
ncbi:MAG: hypothetical protein BGO57_16200 [Sphingomonadales bacterium 63-6]|nr:MAG: hypothetical protein BGO57_16200 [Sphingomonadales bacterium 63-6]